jgi:hypothetical protein
MTVTTLQNHNQRVTCAVQRNTVLACVPIYNVESVWQAIEVKHRPEDLHSSLRESLRAAKCHEYSRLGADA